MLSSDYGAKTDASLKWVANGVLIGLAFYILNLWRTFSMYPFWLRYNLLAFLSLRISIPSIFFVVPKFFISNSLLSWTFTFLIFSLSWATINISSTYKRFDSFMTTHDINYCLYLFLDEVQNFDIMKWWKSHESTFSKLSKMECDLLTPPVSTVTLEYSFFIVANVIGDRRTTLTTKMLEVLTCLKD